MGTIITTPIFDYNQTKGNVSIKVFKGKKQVDFISHHNLGTLDLCKYLRDALTGEYVIARRPAYIIPCYRAADGSLKNLFSYGIIYNGTSVGTDKDDKCPLAILKFLIPNTILSTGKNIAGFRLYSADIDRTLYAECDLGSVEIEVEKDTHLEVEWTLKVSPSAN